MEYLIGMRRSQAAGATCLLRHGSSGTQDTPKSNILGFDRCKSLQV